MDEVTVKLFDLGFQSVGLTMEFEISLFFSGERYLLQLSGDVNLYELDAAQYNRMNALLKTFL